MPRLDVVLGVSKVFISLMSLRVAMRQSALMAETARQNEKLVVASTLPYLTAFGSEFDGTTDRPRLSLALKNGGWGRR